TPLADFLKLIFHKLTHMHYLFITHQRGTVLQTLNRGTALLIYALLLLWALRMLPKAVNRLRYALHEWRCPTVDAVLLVTLWAVIALAFHFALALRDERYATSFVVFAWPALVAEVERRGKAIIWLGLAICGAAALIQSSYRFIDWNAIAEPARNDWRNYYRSM